MQKKIYREKLVCEKKLSKIIGLQKIKFSMQAIHAMKLWCISSHNIDWDGTENFKFFEEDIQMFQTLSYTESICKTINFFKQATLAIYIKLFHRPKL